jgi:putative ABC transport system ATP-binding protein
MIATAPALPAANETAIELVGVTKTYGEGSAGFQALRGIDFRIERGEFVAITGPSGSGKSTVMNILGCLDVPTSGTYRFDGVAIDHLARNQRALVRRYFIGFVFRGFNLLGRTSAVENVELPLIAVFRRKKGARRHWKRSTANESVRLSGVIPFSRTVARPCPTG